MPYLPTTRPNDYAHTWNILREGSIVYASCRFEGFDGVDLREKLEKEVPYEINETKVDCLVTMYDFDRNCPMLISTKDKASNSKFASEIGMKDICRASAAAPTLFRPAKVTLLGLHDRDGSTIQAGRS